MRVALVHLSDIHFKVTSNVLISRLENLVAAIRPTLQQVQGCVVAVTGDVAYSGDPLEYDIAVSFFEKLRGAIRKAAPDMPVEFVFIPGNHDCNFRTAGEVRSALLEALPEKIEGLDPGGEIAQRVVGVQDEFFCFQSRFGGQEEVPRHHRLRYRARVCLGANVIVFDCYNTAWMSRISEQQGTLLFPVHLLIGDPPSDEDDDLRVCMLHHRENWFESNNARLLREQIDLYSDIVLTGHEHFSDTYKKTKLNGAGVQYVEGAVLQDSTSPGNSGFNVVEVDFDGRMRVLNFRWSGQRYSSEGVGDWVPFERNRGRGRFQVTPGFMRALRDPGTGFFHPGKADISLDDIFVYPDLLRKSFKKIVRSDSSARVVHGQDVVGFVARSKNVMITGPDDSGRSSLARMLYLELRHQHKLIPVLLDGEDLHGRNVEASLKREVERALGIQYCGDVAEPYSQLDRSRKVLIVDDWHKVKLGEDGQRALLDQAERSFEYVVCFADDVFAVDQLAGGGAKPFREYEICEIRELGHLRRNELIRKWHSLGADYAETESDAVHSIAAIEATVNTLLGKNLLPAYPVIVLAILQSYSTGLSANSSTGSYGQMYEALITAALASVSKKAVDLGTKYTYISRMAYHAFKKGAKELAPSDLDVIHRGYYEHYRINLNLEEMIEQLVGAQILSRTNGSVRFKYKYIYCYFVAKYYQDNIANLTSEGSLRAELHDIADMVYLEDYANIIIFYVYLTKDRAFIEHLLANANRIYREQQPCDLISHVEFVNRIGTENTKLELPSADVGRNREDVLRRKDAAEEEAQSIEEKNPEPIKYQDDLPDFVKIHIALKNLRILGQIVRNFPGALKADLKVDLTYASYQLGLRTLRAILLVAESNIEELRTYVGRLIQEKRAVKDPKELGKEADKVVVSLTRDVAFGMVKRISQAVGLEELSETYREILEQQGARLPVRVIDYSIKLDHFSRFPKQELERIIVQVERNPLTLRLLRDLTADYLYLFPTDFRIRQYIGETLGITVNTPNILGSGSKRVKVTSS